LRQSRSYGALHETHRQVDEQQSAPAEQRQARNYGALHETQHRVDEQQNAAPEPGPERPDMQRSWSHRGGMVPQQESANHWIRQNNGIRMSDNEKPGAGREEPAPGVTRGEGAQPSQPGRDQNDPELQEARAAVEEARRREAAERARMQERERSGPER
jgi:hypothetical protein